MLFILGSDDVKMMKKEAPLHCPTKKYSIKTDTKVLPVRIHSRGCYKGAGEWHHQ